MMKYCFLLLIGLLASGSASAQTTAPALLSASFEAHMANDFRRAGELAEQAFSLPGAPVSAGAFYNAACSWARAGEPAKAFHDLDRAAAAGWDNLAQLTTDTDLTSLHADPRWPLLLQKVTATKTLRERTQNLPLKRELVAMRESDQGPRRAIGPLQQRYGAKSPQLDSLFKQMELQDAKNEARLKAIVAQYGWPGASLVGRDGSNTAFLIIQHADLATIQQYLPRIRQEVAAGGLDKQSLALMEDRVLMYQGKPQLYGTQMRTNQATGKSEFYTIQDEARVDERRATMGLGPLAGYAKMFSIDYVPVK